MARITVEDCTARVPNRYELVHIAARRARQLMHGAHAVVGSENKANVTALREIAEGAVLPVHPEPVEPAAAEETGEAGS